MTNSTAVSIAASSERQETKETILPVIPKKSLRNITEINSEINMSNKTYSAVSSTKWPFSRDTHLSSESSDYKSDFPGKGGFASIANCFKSSQVKITKKSTESVAEEDAILKELKAFNPDRRNFVKWESSFIYEGHLCQDFELLDMSLKEFFNKRKTSSLLLKDIRPILRQLATALTFLKGLGIAHRDLKPDNIMLADHANKPLKVKVVNFSSACHISKAEQGMCIQTMWYRAPEIILGLPYNEAIDMWSLGCIAVELFLGFALYPGISEYEMIWNMTKTLGQLPDHLLSAGLNTKKFYLRCQPNRWRLMKPHEYGFTPLSCTLSSLDDLKTFQQMPDSFLTGADIMINVPDLEDFVELVKQMLHLVPTQRITPSQVLQHPFIQMDHLLDLLDSSCHLLPCLGMMNISHPQRMSSDQDSTKESLSGNQEPTQESLSGDHESISSSCTAESTQSLLPASEEDPLTFTHTKLPQNRKQVKDNDAQNHNRSLGGSSPAKNKSCICEKSSLLQRPSSQIPAGRKSISGISLPLKRKRVQDDVAQSHNRNLDSSSPARKKRRICEESFLLKNPNSQILADSKRISEMSLLLKRMKLEDGVAQNRNRNPDCSSLGMKGRQLCEGSFLLQTETDSESILEICSPERRSLTKDTEEKDSPVTLSTYEDLSSILERWIHEMRLQSEPRPSECTSSTVIQLKPEITTETAWTSSNESQRVTKIWIIGSSYIKRGEKAAHHIFGENFGLDAEVEWFGKGGMRWSGVLPRLYEELSTRSPPDILVIHAGGNDLGLISAQELASLIQNDLMQIHAEFPSMNIAYSCINERRAWKYGNPQYINKDRKIVNTILRKAVNCFGGVVIQHPHLRFFDKTTFVRDGVHFSRRGNELFLTDIQTAIKKILVKSS